jgi:hypothetical protein
LSRTSGETVAGGPYAINEGSLANSNYTIAYTGSNLTITPASLTVAANAQSKLYGSVDPSLTYQVSGLQFTDTKGSVLSGALSRTTGETVASGPYAINEGSLAANSNYTIAYTGSNLTITPAVLTYVANSSVSAFGSSLPSYSGIVTGFVNGDTLTSATTGVLTWIARATQGSQPGTYSINGSGLTAVHNDYSFVQAAGNAAALLIEAAIAPPFITQLPVSAGSLATLGSIQPSGLFQSNGETGGAPVFLMGPAMLWSTEGNLGGTPPVPGVGLTGQTGSSITGSGASGAEGPAFLDDHGATQSGGSTRGSEAVLVLQTSGAVATITLQGVSQPAGVQSNEATTLSVYLADNNGLVERGQFTVNEVSSSISMEPVTGLSPTLPVTSRIAEQAFFDALLADVGTVQIEVTMYEDGTLEVKLPATFVQAHGIKNATLVGLMAAKQKLHSDLSQIKVVKIMPQ